MHTKFRLLLALASLASLTARAQSPRTIPTNPDSALRLIIATLDGTPLSLQAAVASALANATSVQFAAASYHAASGARQKEVGVFDPELFFSFDHVNQQTPTASFFAGAPVLTTKQNSMNTGIRFFTPVGTNLEASLSAVRLETNSGFAFLNPQYTTFASVSLRQPLLNGLFISASKNVVRADKEMEAAKARYDQEILAVNTLVEQTYWDLYAAVRDFAVQKLTRDRAEVFLQETETRAKIGLIGPNQVATARTFLAEQEILLLDREEQLDRISDQLSSLIGRRPDADAPRFLAVDDPPYTFLVEDVDVLIEKSLKMNLNIQAASLDVEAKRALANAAFWEAFPKVDLVGLLGGNGLTGAPRDVYFGNDTLRTTVRGSFGDAVSQAVQRKFPAWSLGVEVSIPLLFRSGVGEKDRLDAELVMAEQRKIQLSRLLEEQVRSTYRELYNGTRRLTTAREGVRAAQEQIRIGLIEFQNGRSTAFELVRLGADFAVAQQRYTQALVRSAKAAANLRQLTSGTYPSLQN